MPTVFTHAVVGTALAGLGPQAVPRGRLMLVLALLALMPDADVIGFQFGIEYAHPLGHRGFSHSLVFAFAMGVLVPTLAFPSVPRWRGTWWRLFALCTLATASHGLLDALTDAGLGVGFFIPFDNSRYFFPWRPIDTSPLSISAFFEGPALRILWSEVRYVGLPLAVVAAVIAWIRRRR